MNFYRSCLVLSLFVSCAANADTLNIYPDRDATLIEHPHGELANGAGPALFAGRTSQSANALRRTLLHFDVAGALPETAIIENVSLTLHLSRSNSEPVNMSLHRVLDDWNEGPSSSAGGGGDIAQPGDATWLHTNYDVAYWKRVGGIFVARESAMAVVGASAFYAWQYNPHMLADVRAWLRTPHRNFGWMLVGDENIPQSVKRFDSRETSTAEYRPVLTINYRLPGIHEFIKE
jgi:hypothetical protein